MGQKPVSQHATYNEVDELRGRLTSLMVNYPDTEIRLKTSIAILDALLRGANSPGAVQYTVEDLLDLRAYFKDITDNVEELRPKFAPAMALIERLLGPVVQ